MDLFGTIGEWIDTGVDWVAKAVGYEDERLYDAFGDLTTEKLTAGQKLAFDVKSFTDSDTFGFIQKGAGYYAKSAGLLDQRDEPKGGYFKPPTSVRGKARSVSDLTSGSQALTRSTVMPTKVNTGYNNPDVRSYLTQLLNNSYNQQMNNMFSSYLVAPTKTTGQRTIGIGTTGIKGVAKKSKTSRKSRGLE